MNAPAVPRKHRRALDTSGPVRVSALPYPMADAYAETSYRGAASSIMIIADVAAAVSGACVLLAR